jgi:ATP-binding cassette subfamily E protein 1
MNSKKTAFIVEHDFIMATYLADRVIVYDGIPSVSARANRYKFINKPPIFINWNE